MRYECEAYFPVHLGEEAAARLLSAVRSHGGRPGTGDASETGMTWHAGDVEALNVVANAEPRGTRVTVNIDRSGGLVVTGLLTAGGLFFGIVGATIVGAEVNPALGAVVAASATGGVLALARGMWASSTRSVRQRLATLMDTIDRSLLQYGRDSSPADLIGRDGAGKPLSEGPGDVSQRVL